MADKTLGVVHLRRMSVYMLPSVLQALVAFGMLPVTTNLLGPEEFGEYALLASISSMGIAVSGLGASFLLSAHYPVVGPRSRRALISTLIWSGLALSVFFAVSAIVFWPIAANKIINLGNLPVAGVYIAAATMIFSIPWMIAAEVLVLDGEPGRYALIVCIQLVLSALTTAIALYVLRIGMLSLLAGPALAAAASCAGAFWALRGQIQFRIHLDWLKSIGRLAPSASMSSLAEASKLALERLLLLMYVGNGPLGLYSHSQLYRTAGTTGVKAVARSVMPMTLSEGRESGSNFDGTIRAWNLVHLTIIAGGLIFATFGWEIVSFLTHNKFTAAAPLISVWIIWLLIRNSGRNEWNFLVAMNQGRDLSRLATISVIAGVIVLAFAVQRWGLLGAVAAAFAQEVTLRVGLAVRARMWRSFPFADKWAYIGIVLMSAVTHFSMRWNGQISPRMGLLCLTLIPICFVMARETGLLNRTASPLVPAPLD